MKAILIGLFAALTVASASAREFRSTVKLHSIAPRSIDLPSHLNLPPQTLSFGDNLYLSVIEALTNDAGIGVITDPVDGDDAGRGTVEDPDPILWNGSPIAAGEVKVTINEISFQSGSRGTKEYYGFKDGTLFTEPFVNEFREPFKEFTADGGLRRGLELGDESRIDLVLAGGALRHARYDAVMSALVEIVAHDGRIIRKQVKVKSTGFYVDFNGHFFYQGSDFSIGVTIAKRAAITSAFKKLVRKLARSIGNTMEDLPLLSKIVWKDDDQIYIGLGNNFGLKKGRIFYPQKNSKTMLYVKEVFHTVARVLCTAECDKLSVGDLVSTKQYVQSMKENDAAPETIEVAEKVDERAPPGLIEYIRDIPLNILKNLWNAVSLPLRMVRYFRYDQKLQQEERYDIDLSKAVSIAADSKTHAEVESEVLWKHAGLGSRAAPIAVIDSGIDYNHKELSRVILADPQLKAAGVDFISGDLKPFDDYAHGTEIASSAAGGSKKIVGMAPNAALIAVKVFTPFGRTTSSAIYNGFKYAIQAGAKVIVAAWTSNVESKALKAALDLAQANDVLVVTVAGSQKQKTYPAGYTREYGNLITVAARELALSEGLADIYVPVKDVKVARPRSNYENVSHSGIAAGFVAGAAALVKNRCNGLDSAQIRSILINGAKKSNSQHIDIITLSGKGIVEQINQICN